MRRFALALALSGAASPSFAVDYEIIRPNQRYDYDVFGQMENPEVIVLDKKSGKVLIEYLEGDKKGQVEWVAAEKLLTMDESRQQEIDNYVGAAGVGVAVICLLVKSCRDAALADKSGSKGSPQPGKIAASLPDGPDREVVIDNRCPKPLRFRLAYYRDGKFLADNGGWLLNGSEKVRLASNDILIKADNERLYFFARSIDETKIWKGQGKYMISLGNETFDMVETAFKRSGLHYELALSCA